MLTIFYYHCIIKSWKVGDNSMKKRLSRFKRDVVLVNQSNNRARVRINPASGYSRLLRDKANTINKMLEALEESGYYDQWSSKKLLDNLQQQQFDLIQNKRINVGKINKSRTMTNLTALNKYLTDFLESKTSTVQGTRAKIDKYRESIAQYADSKKFADSLTDEEIYQFYQIYDDPDYSTVVEKLDPSDLYILMLNSVKEKTSKKDFLKQLTQRGYDIEDIDLGLALNNIYDKYIASLM